MPFPSSFETVVPLDLRGHERLDSTKVTTLLERMLRASDALLDNHVSAAAHTALGFLETVQLRCFRKVVDPSKLPR